jgi:hypothetical protein
VSAFRGDDATLEHEIETLEAIARLRVRRAARELKELDRDLAALRAERARRRARAHVPATASDAATA